MSSSDNRVVLVTGANKGIGLEAVEQLSRRIPSGTILLGSRSTANGEAAIKKLRDAKSDHSYDNIKVVAIDITDKSSLYAAVEHVKSSYGQLDVLLHNSGISNVNGDQLAAGVLDTNVRGAHDAVEAFLPLIPEKGLVVLVSSEVGAWTMDIIKQEGSPQSQELYDRLDDPSRNDWPEVEGYISDWVEYSKTKTPSKFAWPRIEGLQGAYTVSKAMITAWTRHFARAHPEVKVALVCPGYCATELNGWSGPRSAAQGGESVIWPIFNEFETGRFYQDGKELPFTYPMPAQFQNAGFSDL